MKIQKTTRRNLVNHSNFYASYINTPPPSDLPIPEFKDGVFIIRVSTPKTKIQLKKKTIKKNKRRKNTRRTRNRK